MKRDNPSRRPAARPSDRRRRHFLASGLAMIAGALLARPRARQQRPIDIPEKPLREADFYEPHDLQG